MWEQTALRIGRVHRDSKGRLVFQVGRFQPNIPTSHVQDFVAQGCVLVVVYPSAHYFDRQHIRFIYSPNGRQFDWGDIDGQAAEPYDYTLRSRHEPVQSIDAALGLLTLGWKVYLMTRDKWLAAW